MTPTREQLDQIARCKCTHTPHLIRRYFVPDGWHKVQGTWQVECPQVMCGHGGRYERTIENAIISWNRAMTLYWAKRERGSVEVNMTDDGFDIGGAAV